MGHFSPQSVVVAAIIGGVALVVGFAIAILDRLTESPAMRTRFNAASEEAIAADNLMDETRRNARELMNP